MDVRVYFEIIIVGIIMASAQSTPFEDCENGDTSPVLSLDVYGCDETPCDIYIGRNVTADVTFKAPVNTSVMVPKVKAIVDLWVTNYSEDLEFSQKDACSTLIEGRCPLTKGDTVTYHFTMPVKAGGGFHANIEVSLEDSCGYPIGCLALPVKIHECI